MWWESAIHDPEQAKRHRKEVELKKAKKEKEENDFALKNFVPGAAV
jgi:hypothetical protein